MVLSLINYPLCLTRVSINDVLALFIFIVMASYNKKDSVDVFLGTDSQGNPINDAYMFKGDSRYTEKSEDIARRYNWNMMLYQNAYNDPSAELQRIKDAGLNPLFYLGNNAGTTPSASGGSAQGHSMSSGSGSTENFLQGLNTAVQAADSGIAFRKQMLDYDVQKEANAIAKQNADTNARLAGAQIPFIQSQQDYYDYALSPKTLREMAQIDENIRYLQSQGKLNDETAKQVQANSKYLATLDKYYDQMVGVAGSQKSLYHAMAKYYGSQSAYTDLIANPMAKKLQEEAGLSKEEARKVSIEASNAIFSGNILQYQAYLMNKYGESEKVAQILETYGIAVNQGMSALNTGVNTFFNVTSGGLYGAKNNLFDGFAFPSFKNP